MEFPNLQQGELATVVEGLRRGLVNRHVRQRIHFFIPLGGMVLVWNKGYKCYHPVPEPCCAEIKFTYRGSG
jgi:hypothetical protein